MAHIKKMVMQGFKSFARKTEVIFEDGINVVIGPNGSGKSNISDALCFAMGRLSIKSMRAAKAKNLIFMGTKAMKPAREASVELIFDNKDRSFNIDKDEVSLQRIVRQNGQGIYKINGETKTRGEIVELLAHAGIDPHGFNLVLQGQIQSIVRMPNDDRRKIIEEVAGISIYESRKEKSLRELERTENRLKEISTILRERSAYLRNLEKEKAQAEKFQQLQDTVKKCKASILNKRLQDKTKELEKIEKSIDEKSQSREKLRERAQKINEKIGVCEERIEKINKNIQASTGLEQETLHTEIANLKAEIEGLRVRKENYGHRKEEIDRRISELKKNLPELEKEAKELREKSPLMAKKAQELKKKKEELSVIEDERKKALSFKVTLDSVREKLRDRERMLAKVESEGEQIIKQIEEFTSKLEHQDKKSCQGTISKIRELISKEEIEIEDLDNLERKLEKDIFFSQSEITRLEKIKVQVSEIDTCPLCQVKMTEEHLNHVLGESNTGIKTNNSTIKNNEKELHDLKKKKEEILLDLNEKKNKLSSYNIELERLSSVDDKKTALKRVVDEQEALRKEISELREKQKSLENKTFDVGKIEETYHNKIMEIEEISSRTEEDLDTVLLYKEREIENTKGVIKRSSEDLDELEDNIGDLSENLEKKEERLEKKEEQEKELNEKFKKLFSERDSLQKENQQNNMDFNDLQNEGRQIEEQTNYLKIGRAKIDAERESLETDLKDYPNIEFIQGSVEYLTGRMNKAQEGLNTIGSINMRALEVYEEVKGQYEEVYQRVETLEKEKTEILKIIEEIDKKKKRSFMKTFKSLNEIFTKNFAKLSTKGTAYLELENKEDIFSGGVTIVVKLAKGKYFDVTSLSGGEQTLVALSLLFAIQEYKPYHFYVFDEIDAALDKRNSERLAALLKQYMKAGQYIVVTHNDAIILESNLLYGVSMHEGISKILSLRVQDEEPKEDVKEKAS